jgi:hypothetical protein
LEYGEISETFGERPIALTECCQSLSVSETGNDGRQKSGAKRKDRSQKSEARRKTEQLGIFLSRVSGQLNVAVSFRARNKDRRDYSRRASGD